MKAFASAHALTDVAAQDAAVDEFCTEMKGHHRAAGANTLNWQGIIATVKAVVAALRSQVSWPNIWHAIQYIWQTVTNNPNLSVNSIVASVMAWLAQFYPGSVPVAPANAPSVP